MRYAKGRYRMVDYGYEGFESDHLSSDKMGTCIMDFHTVEMKRNGVSLTEN